MDIEYLVAFPGSLIVYCYHCWLYPVCSITGRIRRFWVDRSLYSYVRRIQRISSPVMPMNVLQTAAAPITNGNDYKREKMAQWLLLDENLPWVERRCPKFLSCSKGRQMMFIYNRFVVNRTIYLHTNSRILMTCSLTLSNTSLPLLGHPSGGCESSGLSMLASCSSFPYWQMRATDVNLNNNSHYILLTLLFAQKVKCDWKVERRS